MAKLLLFQLIDRLHKQQCVARSHLQLTYTTATCHLPPLHIHEINDRNAKYIFLLFQTTH
ncbi:hypothetical protein ALT785_770074 [Alteromonas infernus]